MKNTGLRSRKIKKQPLPVRKVSPARKRKPRNNPKTLEKKRSNPRPLQSKLTTKT